jgi:twitching motility protein PilU
LGAERQSAHTEGVHPVATAHPLFEPAFANPGTATGSLVRAVSEITEKENPSDIFAWVGAPLCYKREGQTKYGSFVVGRVELQEVVAQRQLNAEDSRLGREELMAEPLSNRDFVLVAKGRRYRCSLFLADNGWRLNLRPIATVIPTPENLLIPESALKHFRALLASNNLQGGGLVLVGGGTGHGKTTTAISLLQHMVVPTNKHLITLEDPIEYPMQGKLPAAGQAAPFISQRELGRDFLSFKDVMRSTLRQGADVLFVGEIRDAVTAQLALDAASTGHLALATVHGGDPIECLNRMANLLKIEQSEQATFEALSLSLQLLVFQQLRPHVGGRKRVPIHQVLVTNTGVRNALNSCNFNALKHEMATGGNRGQVSYKQSVRALVDSGDLSYADYAHVLNSTI